MYPLYVMENCTACRACEKACKEGAISVEVEIKPDGRRFMRNYSIDYDRCNCCMKCVERCKKGAIVEVDGEKPSGRLELRDLVRLKKRLGIGGRRAKIVGDCLGCLTCYITCPLGAVRYRDEDGYRVIEIDGDSCGGCGMCARNCPNMAIELS